MTNITIHPAQSLKGEITVPSDKSISHRSLIFAALAEGESTIRNLLLGEDVLCTMTILQQLGVAMSHTAKTIKPGDVLKVQGKGIRSLKKSNEVLYCGNSGTTMRLMMGLLAGQSFESVLTGDESLNRRPMERVMKPLREMGADFEIKNNEQGRFIHVKGSTPLKGIKYQLPVASAQLKTALFLASLFADSPNVVTEPSLSRDHTERMLSALGVGIERDGLTLTFTPAKKLKSLDVTVPGDYSSSAFFIVAGLIVPNSQIKLLNVGVNPTRDALSHVLRQMGGSIEYTNQREVSGEPVADIVIKSSKLNAGKIAGDIVPKLIDEIPVFSIAASRATGKSVVSDAQELRVKESDRIKTIAEGLTTLGVSFLEKPDGIEIDGNSEKSFLSGKFTSHGDHRIAMSFAIAALCAEGDSEIQDIDCVATSFPGFFDQLESLRR